MKQLQVALDRVVAGLKEIGYDAFASADQDHIGTVFIPAHDHTESDIQKITDKILELDAGQEIKMRKAVVIHGILTLAYSTPDADEHILSSSRALGRTLGYTEGEIEAILGGTPQTTNDMIAKSLALGLLASSGVKLMEAKLPMPIELILADMIGRAYLNNHPNRSFEDDRETITKAVSICTTWFETQEASAPKTVQ